MSGKESNQVNVQIVSISMFSGDIDCR